MNKLQHTNKSTEFHFEAAIKKAALRVGMESGDVNLIVSDIVSTFPNVEKETILQAIKKGSLGAYGRSYRLSSQEVCIWIREYLSSNQPVFADQNNTDRNALIKKLENNPDHDRDYVLSYSRRK